MKIAAMIALSSPLALAGCMAATDDTGADESIDSAASAQDVMPCPVDEQKDLTPCNPLPFDAPVSRAPVTPAPLYPAPHFGAPIHEAPVYKAPTYQSPQYQNPADLPVYNSPIYSAPSYPGPTFKAPVYEAPIYDAPFFPAARYDNANYEPCKAPLGKPATPACHLQGMGLVIPCGRR
jgi:hypothetical protein